MKRLVVPLFLLLIAATSTRAQVFVSRSGEISFYSYTPLENIEAHNKSINSFLNTLTGEVSINLPVTGFKFEQQLMEMHFNENYMESAKYPQAAFKGKINGNVDYSKDSIYVIAATGILTMHGVSKEVSEKGTLEIKENILLLHCSFVVALQDYHIAIPKLVAESIAEKVEVKVDLVYGPFKAVDK